MKHLPTLARILMGLAFLVFGLNGFLNFIPPPPTGIPEGAMAFSLAMMRTGYLLQLVKGVEVLVGVLLLTNRFVPLALVLIAPNIVNIVLFHAFLMPSGLAVPIVLAAAEAYLAWTYRQLYRPMLSRRATPAASRLA